jgi:hypothetical protein
MIRKLFFILVLSFVCIAAKAQSSHDSLSPSFSKMALMGTMPLYYDSICAKLKLAGINAVTDSFYMRLWIGSIIGSGVMIIEKKDSHYAISLYSYNDANDIHLEPGKAKMKPDELVPKLQKVDFAGMLTQSEIPGFKDNVEDGIFFTLEVKFAGGYKIVQYHSPQEFEDKYNKAFEEFLDLLQL